MKKRGGKNTKKQGIEIPVRVIKEEKSYQLLEQNIGRKKVGVLEKLKGNLRIVKDKDNLPVLDGAKFYKTKVKKNNLKHAEKDKVMSKNYFPKKIEPEEPKGMSEKDESKKKSKSRTREWGIWGIKDRRQVRDKEENYFKKEKRVKISGGLAMMPHKKREKILIASVIGIVSVIFLVWVAVAKNNFSHSFNQERKSSFFEENDLKNSFQELKDKLQEFTGGLEAKKEEPKIEEVAAENNNLENEIVEKIKEKVLIEEMKDKLEKGDL